MKRDMSTVKQKITEHKRDAMKLKKKYPDRLQDINKKLDELKNSWNNLQDLSVKRHDVLNDVYKIHKFVTEDKDLELWVLAEIDGREQHFAELRRHGESLELFNDVRAKNIRDDHQIQLFKFQAEQVENWLVRRKLS